MGSYVKFKDTAAYLKALSGAQIEPLLLEIVSSGSEAGTARPLTRISGVALTMAFDVFKVQEAGKKRVYEITQGQNECDGTLDSFVIPLQVNQFLTPDNFPEREFGMLLRLSSNFFKSEDIAGAYLGYMEGVTFSNYQITVQAKQLCVSSCAFSFTTFLTGEDTAGVYGDIF